MFTKLLLLVSGAIFGLYGLACAFDPALPAGYMGVELGQAGTVEFMAMYGGLQTAMGLIFLYCGLRADRYRTGAICLLLLLGGLGLTRLTGLLVHGTDYYNIGAVCYELTTAALAAIAVKGSTAATDSH
jgi:hypothetical protein